MRERSVGIKKLNLNTLNKRIQFDIKLNSTLDRDDTEFLPLEILDNPDSENTTVRFYIYKVKSTDDDDGNMARTIVPFQMAMPYPFVKHMDWNIILQKSLSQMK